MKLPPQEWVSETLICAAQQGNEAALGILIDSAHPHVSRFAHLLCASRQDAEDAAQESLIILYQKVGALRTVSALSSWVFQIVRRECIRLARSSRREGPDVIDTASMSVEEKVVTRFEADRVALAIAALPEVQRRVLVSRDVLGRSGREVADEFGLSLAATKTHLHRARTAIRVLLAETRTVVDGASLDE